MAVTLRPAPPVHILRCAHTQYNFRPLASGVWVEHLDLTRGGVWMGGYNLTTEEARRLWKGLRTKGCERGN